jgi:phosphatidylglycerol:prolipoprotein diacylglycerol transferase
MYLAAAGLIWILARRLPPVAAPGRPPLSPLARDRLLVWALVGAIIGGRLGYVAIYEPGFYWAAPWEIPRLWRGGMSFHGGLVGVVLSVAWTTRRDRAFFWPSLDRLALLAPFGLALGRLGSFFIGELWGRPGDLPWAVVFPGAGPEPRHPTQLYEALVEGPLLALLLLKLYGRAGSRPGSAAAGFAVFYSLGRLAVEFWRVPDPAWGYLAGNWLTLGQALSLGLGAVGLVILKRLKNREPAD